MRPETGPLQFGDDYTGVFFRGDNAMAEAYALRRMLADVGKGISNSNRAAVDNLIELLESHKDAPGVQYLKPFAECVKP